MTIRVEVASGSKLTSVSAGKAALKDNGDGTWTVTIPSGGGVDLSAVIEKIQESSSSSSDGGGDGGSVPTSNTGSTTMTKTAANGASVSTTTTRTDKGTMTDVRISICGTNAEVHKAVQTEGGVTTTYKTVTADLKGAVITGQGKVSQDGLTFTNENGESYPLTSAPIMITTENGASKGCFIGADGKPIATGKDEIYYQLGEDGMLHAHWVGPAGLFYTGKVTIDGQEFTFNAEGEIVTEAELMMNSQEPAVAGKVTKS